MGEREIGIERERVGGRTEALVAPRRVAKPEVVSPVRGLERDRAPRGAFGFVGIPRAHQNQRERRMRFCQRVVERDGAPCVGDGAVEQVVRRQVVGARGFVGGQLRAGEAGIRQRIAAIRSDRLLEIRDGARDLADVERLELQPAFGERPVRFEARRFAWRHAAERRRLQAELGRQLHDHLVLQLEDAIERAVDFRIGKRIAAVDVDDPAGDPNPVALALEAADHGQRHTKRRGHLVQRSVGAARRFDHTPTIDDAETAERAQIARHRLRDARRQPRRVGIAADVGEVHHRNRAILARDLRLKLHRSRGCRLDAFDRRDEAVAAPRDRLDEPRIARLVAECLAQLRNRLGKCVFGDVGVGPERVEQLLFGDERARRVEQMQQEIQQLRRQLHDGIVTMDAVARAIDEERAEAVVDMRHGG